MDTLNDIYKNGFGKEKIEAMLHTSEINIRTPNDEMGKSMWYSNVSSLIHNSDPKAYNYIYRIN